MGDIVNNRVLDEAYSMSKAYVQLFQQIQEISSGKSCSTEKTDRNVTNFRNSNSEDLSMFLKQFKTLRSQIVKTNLQSDDGRQLSSLQDKIICSSVEKIPTIESLNSRGVSSSKDGCSVRDQRGLRERPKNLNIQKETEPSFMKKMGSLDLSLLTSETEIKAPPLGKSNFQLGKDRILVEGISSVKGSFANTIYSSTLSKKRKNKIKVKVVRIKLKREASSPPTPPSPPRKLSPPPPPRKLPPPSRRKLSSPPPPPRRKLSSPPPPLRRKLSSPPPPLRRKLSSPPPPPRRKLASPPPPPPPRRKLSSPSPPPSSKKLPRLSSASKLLIPPPPLPELPFPPPTLPKLPLPQPPELSPPPPPPPPFLGLLQLTKPQPGNTLPLPPRSLQISTLSTHHPSGNSNSRNDSSVLSYPPEMLINPNNQLQPAQYNAGQQHCQIVNGYPNYMNHTNYPSLFTSKAMLSYPNYPIFNTQMNMHQLYPLTSFTNQQRYSSWNT